MAWVKPPPPVPVTAAMLAPANSRAAYPRYDTPADWNQGASGNEQDVATATCPAVGAEGPSAAGIAHYAPATQAAKATATANTIVGDVGIDYGAYKGQAGRTGYVTPKTPYPDVNSPPIITSVTPNTGGIAGGTAITVTGVNFTGATAVTMGGTAMTPFTVVNPTTITTTTGAKAAGPYGVAVTTPKGTSATMTFTYV